MQAAFEKNNVIRVQNSKSSFMITTIAIGNSQRIKPAMITRMECDCFVAGTGESKTGATGADLSYKSQPAMRAAMMSHGKGTSKNVIPIKATNAAITCD